MAQSIVSNTIIATAGRGINVALGLVVVKLLTNYLGPSGYGAFGLLLSLGAILQLVADFGLYLQLTRTIAEQPEQHSEIASTIFSLRLALLAVVFAVGLSVIVFVPMFQALTKPFIIIAVGLTFQSMSQLAMGIFQHRQVIWRATLGDIVGRLGQIGAVLWFGVAGTTLTSMAAAFTVGSGLAWLVHRGTLPRTRLRLQIDLTKWKQLLSSSWVLGVSLVLSAIYFRVDTVILFLYRSPAEVGWYTAAYRIIESALFLPAMFGGLLLPRLSEARVRRDTHALSQYLSEGLTFQLAIVGFITATLLWRAQKIILFTTDEKFLAAAPLLMILSCALFFLFFGNVFGFAMVALQKQTTLLKIYIGLVLFNVASNMLAVPAWGAVAAAAITVVTEAAATMLCAIIVWRIIPYRIPGRSLVGVVVAGGVASLVYFSAPATWPLAVDLALAAVGYSAGIIATGSITRRQLALLTTIKAS